MQAFGQALFPLVIIFGLSLLGERGDGVDWARTVIYGLFGIGGGTIIVPLLVLWMGYEQREATGTSLTAIAIIGALAAAVHGLYGNVDLGKGLLVAAPAVVGVVAGTAVQQRISDRAVAGAFVVLLVISAVVLVFFSPVVSGKETSMFPSQDWHWFPLSNPGIISIPVGFLCGWLGTLASRERNDAKYAELEVRALTGVGAH